MAKTLHDIQLPSASLRRGTEHENPIDYRSRIVHRDGNAFTVVVILAGVANRLVFSFMSRPEIKSFADLKVKRSVLRAWDRHPQRDSLDHVEQSTGKRRLLQSGEHKVARCLDLSLQLKAAFLSRDLVETLSNWSAAEATDAA